MVWMWALTTAFAGAATPGREEVVLPYEVWGVFSGAPEEKSFGPDHLAVGPNGLSMWVDPTRSQVVVFRDLAVESAFLAWGLDDVAFSADGDVLLLKGRTLELVSTTGFLIAQLPVHELIPTSVTLAVEGSHVFAVDVFGNQHSLAEVGNAGLGLPHGRRLRPDPAQVRRGIGIVEQGSWWFPVVDTKKIGVRAIDSAQVVVVDTLEDTSPLRVTREIVTPNARWTLNVGARLYDPVDDIAVGPDGTLMWFEPLVDGIHLYRMKP